MFGLSVKEAKDRFRKLVIDAHKAQQVVDKLTTLSLMNKPIKAITTSRISLPKGTPDEILEDLRLLENNFKLSASALVLKARIVALDSANALLVDPWSEVLSVIETKLFALPQNQFMDHVGLRKEFLLLKSFLASWGKQQYALLHVGFLEKAEKEKLKQLSLEKAKEKIVTDPLPDIASFVDMQLTDRLLKLFHHPPENPGDQGSGTHQPSGPRKLRR